MTAVRSAPRQSIDVRDFGAKFDGSTDDAAAIQDAVDAVPSSGATVFFPAGTAVVGTTIDLPTDRPVRLEGAGMKVTKLKLKASANQNLLDYDGAAPGGYTDPDAFDYVTISALALDGNKANNTSGVPLRLSYADYFVLTEVLVMNGETFGVRLEACDEGSIFGCFFAGNGTTNSTDGGLYSTSHDLTIASCGFESNTGAGIFMNGTFESTVANCNFWSNHYDVRLQSSYDNTVVGNVMEDAVFHAVLLEGTDPDNNIVVGNRILGCGIDGIRLNDAGNNVVLANLVSSVSGTGVNERLSSDGNLMVMNRTPSLTKAGAASFAFSNPGVAAAEVTGSRGSNAALASLLTALDGMGIVTDSTS